MGSAPNWTEWFKLDQVSETWDGVDSDLSRELWNRMEEEPFFETPGDALGEGPNVLAKHWRKLSKDDRKTLSRLYRQNFPD